MMLRIGQAAATVPSLREGDRHARGPSPPASCGTPPDQRPGKAGFPARRSPAGPAGTARRYGARCGAARPRMFSEPAMTKEVAVEKSGADSCGKAVPCLPAPSRSMPGPGPPPPGRAEGVRGLAPQDGPDRSGPGSRERIRRRAWSARPPVGLPGPDGRRVREPDRREDRSGRHDHRSCGNRREREVAGHPPGRAGSRRHQRHGRVPQGRPPPGEGNAERVVPEATGRMHRALLQSLHDRGFKVVVATPASPGTSPGPAASWRRPTGPARACRPPCAPRSRTWRPPRRPTSPSTGSATCSCCGRPSSTGARN